MFVTRGNILSILSNDNLSYKTRNNIVKKYNKLLLEQITKIDVKQLAQYYFSVPKDTKKIIAQELNKRNITASDAKFIEELFLEKETLKESYLYKIDYPTIFKKILIKYLYQDVYKELNSCKNDIFIKKMIILYGMDKELLVKFLIDSKDNELIKYCMDVKFIDTSNLYWVLNSFLISDEVKENIIKKYISDINILEVFKYPFSDSVKELILNIKNDALFNAIMSLDSTNILSVISASENYPSIIFDTLLKYRKIEIKNAISKLNFSDFKKYLIKINNIDIANIFISEYPYKTKLVLRHAKNINVLSWIYNDSIPMNIKEFIMKNKKSELKAAIKTRGLSSLKLCYLRNSKNIPLDIQKLIINERYDELLLDINKRPSSVIINDILYGNYCDLYVRLLISSNKYDLKELLDRSNEDVINTILDVKKDVISNKILNMDIDEFFSLNYFSNDYAKEKIIIDYNDILLKKINLFDKDILYKYLKNYNTYLCMKKIILNKLGIESDALDNCVQLIAYNDVDLVINNYYVMKEFIEKSGIDFNSFIQYGCGSECYKDWFLKILEIIKYNKQEEFFMANNYLMSNVYNENENLASNILNYLSIINNYKDCYVLVMNLVNDNVLLSNEDKNNIKRLFLSKEICKKDLKYVSEIPLFMMQVIDNYKSKIIKSSNIDELKSLFNEVVADNANKTLEYIGYSEALLRLKEINKDSKDFTLFVDELLIISNLLESIKVCNNIEIIRGILKYLVIDNSNNLMKVQSAFTSFKKNIQKLFEIDAKLNLTTFQDNDLSEFVNDELSQKYGGVVYDFSKVNYCLYAHVLSNSEKAIDLVNGISSGKRNFLSVSPISYLGQKYYFDRTSTTFAIDNFPDGNFVCSSLFNMGTNYSIKNNSGEISELNRNERGILETSAVNLMNSEVLLYRENVKVSGIILPGGRVPSEEELSLHQEYNLPFIITQDVMRPIENVRKVFKLNEVKFNYDKCCSELKNILYSLTNSFNINKLDNSYTGREIALFTDAHALYEPTLAVLEDIRMHGISEIYSLGDNIGEGPNPREVLDLLEKYNVKSIAGNSEYYNTLGMKPFIYFDKGRVQNQEWTYDKLSSNHLELLKTFKPSMDILVGDKVLGLCHFANDVRWDYMGDNSTWAYQNNFKIGVNSKQFMYTNSVCAMEKMNRLLNNFDDDKKLGVVDALNRPLFGGKRVTAYDEIFQGHVHFALTDRVFNTKINTLRALAMGYNNDSSDAVYYILKEKCDGGFEVSKRLVSFNKNLMLANIISSDIPHKEKILKFVKC